MGPQNLGKKSPEVKKSPRFQPSQKQSAVDLLNKANEKYIFEKYIPNQDEDPNKDTIKLQEVDRISNHESNPVKNYGSSADDIKRKNLKTNENFKPKAKPH